MKIFASHQIKDLDNYTIENEPISSTELMERASQKITQEIIKLWNVSHPIILFAGPGNNGGDALCVGRLLHEEGYSVTCYLFNPKDKLSPDCQINKERLESLDITHFEVVGSQFAPPKLTEEDVVIDGLFGSGLNKPLAGGFAAVVRLINASKAKVVSIDTPSGLMGEDNSFNQSQHIVKADYTFCFQFPRLSFLFAENQEFLGKWKVLPIGLHPTVIEETHSPYQIIETDNLKGKIKKRNPFVHKGNMGHALLIAGSEGMAGAAVLAAKSCLKSGVGLLTVHTPICNLPIIQVAVPEAMAQKDIHESCFAYPVDTEKYQVVGVGPGLGNAIETDQALFEQIVQADKPLVVDADALNFIGRDKEVLSHLPKGSILTPHPKELERIVGTCTNSYMRMMQAADLAKKTETYIILKGAFSTIITPDGKFFFNPTGNAGMATGGSGDVLTGIVVALLAQEYSSFDAALLGTYVHGLAGDLAEKELGEMGMTAMDIINHLPYAWKEVSNI